MGTAEYAIKEKDQIAFGILHFRAALPRFLAMTGVAVLGMMALGYCFDGFEALLSVGIGGVIGIVLMLSIVRFITVPRFAKRAWRDFALIKEPISLSLHGTGFNLVQPSAHVEALWEKMIAWDEDKLIFAIYVTRQQAYILPKDQVDEEHIDYARERLVESGLVARGTKRK